MPKRKTEKGNEAYESLEREVVKGEEIDWDKKFTVARNITLPLIKPKNEEPVYIKITGPMFVGKAVKKAGGGKDMEPATLVNCIDLKTGEESQIIVPAVLKGIFTDDFPNDGYVDKSFKLIKHPPIGDKKYSPFSVALLADPQ